MRRGALWVVLALALCGPVVSVLASPGVGRASEAVGRSSTVAVAARRQRLAELDVSAAAVKLLAGNALAGSATVGNVGAARARPSTANVAWKSSDSGGLVQLGRFTVPALKPGQRHKAKFQFDLPKGASGSYEVSVCAEVFGQVQEHSKKNSCRDAGVITISASGVKASGPTSPEPSSPPPMSPTTPGGGLSSSPTVEATPPQTTITSAPSGRVPIGEVSISFASSEPGSSFECSLNDAAYSPCGSPDVITNPAAGPHTFSVQATNQAGIKETAVPPSASWSSVEPQRDLCGTISSNTTIGPDYAARYVITCSTTIASHATLTAQPGTIIKADQGTRLSVEGTLTGVGTEPEQITFTSTNDNSVGGSTGSGSPKPGDWEGVLVGGEGSVRLGYVVVDYGVNGIEAEDGQGGGDLGAFSVTHSSISDSSEEGVFGRFGVSDTPTISDDTVDGSGGPAMAIDGTNLSAATLNGNSGAGNHGGMYLGGAFTGSGTITESGLDPTVGSGYVGSELVVGAGATVKIPAGQTWKGAEHGQLDVEGTLEAEGTASEPVTFTSINDGTVGGHANGEGEQGSPKPGDWEGVLVGGEGSVRLGYVVVDYGVNGIEAEDGQGGGDLGAFSVTHSSISDSSEEGVFGRFGVSDTPTISDDTVDGSGGPAMAIDGTNLSAATLNGNSGAGNHGGMYLGGAFTGSGTITESGLDPTVGSGYVGSELVVGAGATVKIPAGQTWKGAEHGQLDVEGTLEAEGTASEPVTFTSINDGTVGGHANGEGEQGSPKPGDWEGVLVGGEGSVRLGYVVVDYGVNGIEAEDGQGGGDLGAFSVTHSSISDSSEEGVFGRFGVSDTPTISDDTVDGSGGPAMAIDGTNLSAATLNGNSGAGNHGGMYLGGAFTGSGTITESGLDPTVGSGYVGSELVVGAGATVKIPAGQTWKGAEHGQLDVEGTLEAEGTASEPVTFTSINDGTVGGHANGEGEQGSPKPGDWEGVLASPTEGEDAVIELKHAAVLYATTGLAATTKKRVIVKADVFAHNNTAVDIAASYDLLALSGTNAAIHETWFDENGMALEGSSDWVAIEPCQYVPSMSATGNEYGPLKGSKPFISASEWAEIQAALAVPETEDQLPEIEVGETDRITWSVLPCQPPVIVDPHAVVATPFEVE